MKRVVSVVVGVAAALSGMVALSPTASAYGGYDATATSISYTSENCFTSHISISGFDTSEDSDGSDVEVTAPDGAVLDSDFVYGSYSDTLSPLLCSYSDPVGRYSVTVDGIEVTAFSVARPALSTRTLGAGGRNAQVLGLLSLRGQRLAGRRVALEYQQYGYWYTATTVSTASNGAVKAYCSRRGYNRTCATRFYRFNYNDVAISRAFHLPRRR